MMVVPVMMMMAVVMVMPALREKIQRQREQGDRGDQANENYFFHGGIN
jgi:hypothetical protein